MKITDIQPILVHGGVRIWTFVKVTTDEGPVGWGDATEWARPAGHRVVIDDLAILLRGENPFDIERLWQKMWTASYIGGKDLNVAMTGIETALWDIVGKALNTPVYNLLGGICQKRIRLYFDFCNAYGSVFDGTARTPGDGSLTGVAKQAQMIKELKFTALKTSPAGLPPRPAITRTASLTAINATAKKVDTIRRAVGDDVDIWIDMGNGLDLPTAMAFAKALEPYQLACFEDPLRQDESAGSYKRLVESTCTPVGTGENLYTVWDFRNYLEIGALDLVLPDVSHAGILQAKKIASLAEAFHLPVAPHNCNSPLSTIISAHLAASIPNFLALEYVADPLEPAWRDEVMSPPLGSLVTDGYLHLPTAPGWGVEIHEAELAKHPYQEIWYTRQAAVGIGPA